MIRTATGRKSRIVTQQLWLLGAQAVGLLGWMIGLVPPEVAPWVAGVLGTVQAVSAIVLRQSTSEAMPRGKTGLVGLVLGVVWLGLSGCATLDLEFDCKSDGRIDVFDGAVVNRCIDGSAPTVTFRAKRIYGCGVEPKPTVRVIEGVVVP